MTFLLIKQSRPGCGVLPLLLSLFALISCTRNTSGIREQGVYLPLKTPQGTIIVRLFAEEAPVGVAHLLALAEGAGRLEFTVSQDLSSTVVYLDRRGGANPYGTIPVETIEGMTPASKGFLLWKSNGYASTDGSLMVTTDAFLRGDNGYGIIGYIRRGGEIIDSLDPGDVVSMGKAIRIGKEAQAIRVDDETLQRAVNDLRKREEEMVRKSIAARLPDGEYWDDTFFVVLKEEGTGRNAGGEGIISLHCTLRYLNGDLIYTTRLEAPLLFAVDSEMFGEPWRSFLSGVREDDRWIVAMSPDNSLPLSDLSEELYRDYLVYHIDILSVVP